MPVNVCVTDCGCWGALALAAVRLDVTLGGGGPWLPPLSSLSEATLSEQPAFPTPPGDDSSPRGLPVIDQALRARLSALIEEGRDIFHRFDLEVRKLDFHPFVPGDYDRVLATLLELRAPGLRFLEWGSGTGVIAIIADLIGYEAYGIELDPGLVTIARELAASYGSKARFAVGSFLPEGYEYRPRHGDPRLGTIGRGPSGYLALQHPLDDFDVVYGYPWTGEEPVMRDVMRRHGSPEATLLIHGPTDEMKLFRARDLA